MSLDTCFRVARRRISDRHKVTSRTQELVKSPRQYDILALQLGLMPSITIALALAMGFLCLPPLLLRVEGKADETT